MLLSRGSFFDLTLDNCQQKKPIKPVADACTNASPTSVKHTPWKDRRNSKIKKEQIATTQSNHSLDSATGGQRHREFMQLSWRFGKKVTFAP